MGKSSDILKTTIFILGLASLILAPVSQSMAERGDDDDGYRGHNYNRHYNVGPYFNRHNGYWGGYRRGYGGGYYRGHRGGGDVALGILAGGLLFYALTSNNRRHYNTRTIIVRQQPLYAQPTQQRWVQPRIQYSNNSCLQVREYQTTITVGGQNVPAYGQSCLQADGSWKLGPATPEPGN